MCLRATPGLITLLIGIVFFITHETTITTKLTKSIATRDIYSPPPAASSSAASSSAGAASSSAAGAASSSAAVAAAAPSPAAAPASLQR